MQPGPTTQLPLPPPTEGNPVLPTLRWQDDPPALVLLDQTRLPHEQVAVVCADVATVVDAIRRLVVRGAPVLGVAGGYAVALATHLAGGDETRLRADAERVATARPTAVDLSRGVRRVLDATLAVSSEGWVAAARAEADRLAGEERAASAAMAGHGVTLVPPAARVLTHCNTGRLVSTGAGSALAVVLAAHRRGGLAHLWIDETRPLLQGARLTAFEAREAGLPHTLLTDGAAASLFARGEVDLVLVGADRVAADGSVANKVGTYAVAVLAHHHGVPFVVVAPTSTIDLATPDGPAIRVEQRAAEEVTALAGRSVAPAGTPAYNPAFDVTPPELVTALVTERGVVRPLGPAGLAELLSQPASGATMRR